MILSYAKSNQANCCKTSAVAGTFAQEVHILGTVLLAVSIIVVRVLVTLSC